MSGLVEIQLARDVLGHLFVNDPMIDERVVTQDSRRRVKQHGDL